MIYLVAGARPNFMKVAPVARKLEEANLAYRIIHTGQHYDAEMSGSFFEDLDLPAPHIYLGVGSGTHAEQTGRIMIAFEKVCLNERPDMVVVVGDVNSTLACALVAAKLGIRVAHIEAGLRSFDRTMPEEINRLLTDQISDLLFTTCEDADRNLRREGIPADKIFLVGNVMIDSLLRHRKKAAQSDILERLALKEKSRVLDYALVTLHRPANVDEPVRLGGLLTVLNEIHRKIPVVFPAHPRTLKKIKEFGLSHHVHYAENLDGAPFSFRGQEGTPSKIWTVPPLGYLDFLCLMSQARLVLTDSGGIQEESTILGIPCLTIRANTERPITITQGTNRLVGQDPAEILPEVDRVLEKDAQRKKMPPYWDGRASERIVKILSQRLR
jgi:UDP-N-acetylglucosamine 2-epimerase (non-hydrolysing)